MTPTAPEKKNILCVVGTRPECIKMAPVINALHSCEWANVDVVSTGQHRELVRETLGVFSIEPDLDLDVMIENQSLSELSSRIFDRFDRALDAKQYDLVLVQGDTTTVMVASLVCFYRQIAVGHVEAGLRTHDMNRPFPEEFNRRVTSLVTKLHFAPTNRALQNLLDEKVDPSSIHVTGNTVIDALLEVAARNTPLTIDVPAGKRLVLVTAHRRENWGAPLQDICKAVEELHAKYSDLCFVLPVHPNPNVARTLQPLLGGLPRVKLVPPLDYQNLVGLLNRCHFVLTDSGGIQEEAPALSKPVLVMRTETERPEAVEAGVAKVVGTSTHAIVHAASKLLEDPSFYADMAKGGSPYGDGNAAQRIAEICRTFLLGS